MEPTSPTTPRTVASTTCQTAIDDLEEVLRVIDLQEAWERSAHERSLHGGSEVRTRAFSVANDNNAHPVREQEQRRGPDPDLELLGPIDKVCFGCYDRVVAYFKENSWCIDLPSDSTGNTPLLSAVRLFTAKSQSSGRLITYIAALLELGANKYAPNHEGLTPFAAALATKDELLLELFQAEKPFSKEQLIELAQTKKHDSLKHFLTTPEYRMRFEVLSAQFVHELKQDPVNAFEKVTQFYLGFPEIVQYKNPVTGDSTLHDAVENYLNGQPFGILEVLVLLKMGADRHAPNVDGDTAQQLAIAGGNKILKELMAEETPTIDHLYTIVFNNAEIDLVLFNWLVNVE